MKYLQLIPILLFLPLLLCAQAPGEETRQAIHQLLDDWHRAAATADEEVFFGSMAPGAIYLGTDPSERWTKEEFEEWAMPYFQRDTAWAFTPRNRELYFSPDATICWFEELLDTWMGTCRGSGVLQWDGRHWRIRHYNLAVTIANDKIEGFIKLTERKE